MAISKPQRERLVWVAAKPEADIDTSDIPEVVYWSASVQGGIYRPRN
jgi:hypothetical protein